jgi:hypothetical protein
MNKKIFLLLLLATILPFSLYADLNVEISLIDRNLGTNPTISFTPPAELEIGVDISDEALYKLSDEKGVIKGGLLKVGFNSIYIPANLLFINSGTHKYFLDFKSGDALLRKEIDIAIQLTPETSLVKKSTEAKPHEYKLSLYVGDELILSSTKTLHLPSLMLGLPPLPENYRPFNPRDKSNPLLNSISIPDAVAAINEVIKYFVSKKETKIPASYFKKLKQLTITYKRLDQDVIPNEVNATITLKAEEENSSPSNPPLFQRQW